MHPKIIGKIDLEPNYANLVIKIIKSYTNCGIIAVVMGIILSIIGNFLSIAQKHTRYKIEHNRPGLILECNVLSLHHSKILYKHKLM